MKKIKLGLESFSSYSISHRQALSVLGGIPVTPPPPPPLIPDPEDGGPIGTGGTGSGPVDPHHENDPSAG